MLLSEDRYPQHGGGPGLQHDTGLTLLHGLPTQTLTLREDEDGQLAFILHVLGQPLQEENKTKGQTASRPSSSKCIYQYPV